MLYAVNYDLKAPGRDYAGLYDAIKSCGTWWHYLGSTWLIDTALTVGGVWERLAPHIDNNDYVLVIAVGHDKQGWLPEKAWTWINARLTAQAA
jgi:hypothetical protein